MNADQTEQSDLGPYYFQYMLPKCINRREREQTTIALDIGEKVKIYR